MEGKEKVKISIGKKVHYCTCGLYPILKKDIDNYETGLGKVNGIAWRFPTLMLGSTLVNKKGELVTNHLMLDKET